jgi:hypothetical protein
VNCPLATNETRQWTSFGRPYLDCLPPCLGETLLAVDGDDTEIFPVANYQTAVGCAAKSVSLLQYCVKDRREVAGRGVDDLQHLGGRGLSSQRLVTFRSEVVSLGVALSELTLEIGDGLLRIV